MGIVLSEFDSKVFFDLMFVLSSVLVSLGSYIKRHNNKMVGRAFLLLSFIVLVLPLGFRTVGIDHETYREWFDHADFWLKTNYFLTPEPLFAALTIFAKDTLNNFQFIYIFAAVIYMGGIYYFLEKNESLGFVSILFMNASLYLYMCGLARIAIALGIVSYAYVKVESKWRFIIYVSIAILFHYTAVMAFLVYFAFYSKRSITVKSVIYLLGGIYVLSFIIKKFSGALPYAIARYAQYVQLDFQIRNISTVIILLPALILWFLFAKSYSVLYRNRYRFFDNIMKLIVVLMILSISFDGIFRITFYLYPFAAKIYYDFSKLLYKTNQAVVSPFYKMFFLIFSLVYVYAVFYTSPFITPLIIPFEM